MISRAAAFVFTTIAIVFSSVLMTMGEVSVADHIIITVLSIIYQAINAGFQEKQ